MKRLNDLILLLVIDNIQMIVLTHSKSFIMIKDAGTGIHSEKNLKATLSQFPRRNKRSKHCSTSIYGSSISGTRNPRSNATITKMILKQHSTFTPTTNNLLYRDYFVLLVFLIVHIQHFLDVWDGRLLVGICSCKVDFVLVSYS